MSVGFEVFQWDSIPIPTALGIPAINVRYEQNRMDIYVHKQKKMASTVGQAINERLQTKCMRIVHGDNKEKNARVKEQGIVWRGCGDILSYM